MNPAPALAAASSLLALTGCAPAPPRVLLLTATAGYRHESIEAGIEAIRALGERHGFVVEATEDPQRLRGDVLAGCAAVVFLNTTGDILDEPQEQTLKAFVLGGGGFAGIHAAADTEHGWPWYGRLVGARFTGHGPVEAATVHVSDRSHPSTSGLPAEWARVDEWYQFSAVGTDLLILATLEGDPARPIAWCQGIGRGRSWYTACGHTVESYTEPLFLEHLAGGMLWVTAQRGPHGGPYPVGSR